MAMLSRIWAGIVGGVAGAAVGLVVTILLLRTGFPLEVGLWSVAALALIGAILSASVGNKTIRSR